MGLFGGNAGPCAWVGAACEPRNAQCTDCGPSLAAWHSLRPSALSCSRQTPARRGHPKRSTDLPDEGMGPFPRLKNQERGRMTSLRRLLCSENAIEICTVSGEERPPLSCETRRESTHDDRHQRNRTLLSSHVPHSRVSSQHEYRRTIQVRPFISRPNVRGTMHFGGRRS